MKVNDCCLGFIVSVQRTKRAAPFHQVECLKKSTTGLHFICFLCSERWRRTDSNVDGFLTIWRMFMRLISLNKTVYPPPPLTGSRQIPGGCRNHLARVLQRHRRHQGFGPLVEKSHLQGDLQTGQRRPWRIQDILLFVGPCGSSQQPGTRIIWSFLVVNCSEPRCWIITHFVAPLIYTYQFTPSLKCFFVIVFSRPL